MSPMLRLHAWRRDCAGSHNKRQSECFLMMSLCAGVLNKTGGPSLEFKVDE